MKKWYLQVNENCEQFWDTYLHPQCSLIMTQVSEKKPNG
jgi:hypothetical protein